MTKTNISRQLINWFSFLYNTFDVINYTLQKGDING